MAYLFLGLSGSKQYSCDFQLTDGCLRDWSKDFDRDDK